MGILNVTPDSFYDGGQFVSELGHVSLDRVMYQADQMVQEGAAFLDVGGESTRPGAKAVSVAEEIDRVLPVVNALAERFDVVISVDTSSPDLMCEAAKAGAGLINDVRALSRAGALDAAVRAELPVCLMHMQGTPQTMQDNPVYQDLIGEVANYFKDRVEACRAVGIDETRIILDPGIGFGKTDAHNLALIKYLEQIRVGQCPMLVGVSRKSIFGRLLNRPLEKRLAGSLALGLIALQNGAAILRVHDVAETADAVNLLTQLQEL